LSQELYDNIRNIHGVRRKVALIENAVDIDEIEDEALISREIVAWKNRGHSIIGYIGRLTEGKGISVLLKAFARLKLNSTRLAIVGDGEQLHELEQRVATLGIGDSVCFFGFRNDRFAFLRGFDVFVLPSRSEGTPRCLMEAMAVGVPVVATDIPGCRDLVEDNVTGLLFPVDDDESLADRLSVMLADSQLRDSVARGARALIKSRYSAEVMASRYAELYAGLVCKPCAIANPPWKGAT
jgi:glycosyltransferase involved in cell wall biosynthesis